MKDMKKSRGQAMIEMALTAPLMIAVMGASLDIGKMVFIKQRLDTATTEAVRFVPGQVFDGPVACQDSATVTAGAAGTAPLQIQTLCQTLKTRTEKLLASSLITVTSPLKSKIETVSASWLSNTTTPLKVKLPASISRLSESDATMIMLYGIKLEYPYTFLGTTLKQSTLTSIALGFAGTANVVAAPAAGSPPSDLKVCRDYGSNDLGNLKGVNKCYVP